MARILSAPLLFLACASWGATVPVKFDVPAVVAAPGASPALGPTASLSAPPEVPGSIPAAPAPLQPPAVPGGTQAPSGPAARPQAAEAPAGPAPAPEQAAARAAVFFDRSSRGLAPAAGLFGPDSMMWRVNGHQMGRFGAFGALAVQGSHPLVAESAKVTRALLKDPHRRLLRTADLLELIMFGDRASALAAVRMVNERHAGIHGVLEEGVGRFPAGTPFSAKDPELLKWVLGTVHHFTQRYYESFVARLTPEEKERYWREMKFLGVLLGIPPRLLPADHRAQEAYLQAMFESPDLAVGRTARELASAFLGGPKLPWPLSPLLKIPAEAAKQLVIGYLPERLRTMNDLPWGWRERLTFPWQKRAIRLALKAAPEAVLRTPAYHKGRLRVAAARLIP